MTPFKEAGYTKDTNFKVLVDHCDLTIGDIVTLCEDNGSVAPWFKTECGFRGYMYLPGLSGSDNEDLELYEDITPNLL